jgi:quercetin dioxygenase-like cupin family protein
VKLIDMNRLENEHVLPGLRARFVHSESVSFAQWSMDAGAFFPLHDHAHEQIMNVVSGKVEMTVSGEKIILDEGCVLVLAPGEPHAMKALTDSFMIGVYHPRREGYKS